MSDLGMSADSICGDDSKALTKDEYIDFLESRNDELEQLVKRQAPCTDYCEAAAFSITIKNLKSANVELEARVKVLSEALTKTTDELDSWWKDQGDYGTEGYSKWIPELRELINQSQ